MKPVVGITMDLAEVASATGTRLRAECGMAYAACVHAAGATPLFLPPIAEEIHTHLGMIDGLVLTGGGDPRMEPFGSATHPEARLMHEQRQRYETALLAAINDRPELPVLGICLGMQMLALASGGTLEQHLPDRLGPAAERHRSNTHQITLDSQAARALGLQAPATGDVASFHHQAVKDPGKLRVVATDTDGTIEAVVDPACDYRVGVQWHPERTRDRALGQDIFDEFVRRCRKHATT
jgi:putative glutamine amidotransferase